MTPFRSLVAGALLSGLTGCGALSALSGAAEPLDAYTLAPVTFGGAPARGSAHLLVETATSAGALATDRILIKPTRLQAQYLPDGRWSEPAPVLVQTLLLASLQNSGGFALVARSAAGLVPDFTLMTELAEFQAEPAPDGAAGLVVRVAMTLTLIREEDRRIVASRRLEAVAGAASDETAAVVAAFDAALTRVLTDAVRWTRVQAGG